ncbi:NrfJ [Shewanella gelidii]|uniref:NrfJ n=1 Tax=Shewanella gelidii TaxID=1642821 RepID=A0A917JJJ9_9GAMM|nr:NrfJ [Shewanella gelidii]MCL1096963.1 NrfJ [Shewanella gelidii]GGI71513.1 hypothetical protein GCM10009332_06090 [Shewanella gelidii]
MKKTLLKVVASAVLALGVSSAWAQGIVHEGVVLETMNSGGYTYVQFREGEVNRWAAGPYAEVKKGDTVIVVEEMTMENFTSSSLDRTFDEILFAGKIQKK